MTPLERLTRANALAILAPGSGVLRDQVREALAGLDAEAARVVNAPRDDTAHLLATEANARRVQEEVVAEIERTHGSAARLDPPAPRPPADTVVAEVRADLLARSEAGIAKYGVTLDRTDLGPREWLDHFRQELMDAVLYATRAMRDLPATAPAEPLQAAGVELRPLPRITGCGRWGR